MYGRHCVQRFHGGYLSGLVVDFVVPGAEEFTWSGLRLKRPAYFGRLLNGFAAIQCFRFSFFILYCEQNETKTKEANRIGDRFSECD